MRLTLRLCWAHVQGCGPRHCPGGSVDVRGDNHGGHPTGHVYFRYLANNHVTYDGRVVCLKVSGHHAIVGTVGEVRGDDTPPNPNLDPPTVSLVLIVDDDGVTNPPRVGADLRYPPVTPSCTESFTTTAQDIGAVRVYDAP